MSLLDEATADQPGGVDRRRVVLIGLTIAAVAMGAILIFMPGRSREPANPNSPQEPVFPTEQVRVRVVRIADDLEKPWSLAFLPNGDLLVTELPGRLRVIRDGQLQAQAISGVPQVETKDQAGLMDIALHPQFAGNQLIYLTYSKIGPRGNTPALARGRFDGATLTDVRDLFVSDAWSDDSGGNAGSRVVFGTDGTLYMSVGDRHEQKPAQNLQSDKGKIVRLNDDGSVPPDNPFIGKPGVRPEIFATGVRNPQGLFVDRASGTLWETEHGPFGGDELNNIVAGHNYGWPTITYGKNYDGTTISNETVRSDMDQPVVYWTPSLSPSGLTIYDGDKFPAWRGNTFIGALSGAHLRRIVIEAGKAVHQEKLEVAPIRKRIRDVRQGPDGYLYVLTDLPGALLRIEPAP